MDVILIGDIHGRTIWKKIVERHPDADYYVFFGDYFDPYEDIPFWELAKNFKAIVQLKRELGDRVILLLGNHDLHYYADVEPCSRFDYLNSAKIGTLFKENLHLFQVAFEFEGVLCTHAGVSPSWFSVHIGEWSNPRCNAAHINQLHEKNPEAFSFYSGDRSGYGENEMQGPMWIRPRSLIKSQKPLGEKLQFLQLIGHTQLIDKIEDKFLCVDALSENIYWIYTSSTNSSSMSLSTTHCMPSSSSILNTRFLKIQYESYLSPSHQ
jgi:hypothetical protein